jgi:5,6,7,8-tetrahydromethanopterin hydro-lyase
VESRFEEVIQVAAELIPLAEGDLGRDHEIVSRLIDCRSAARDGLAVPAKKAGAFINIMSQQPGWADETVQGAGLRKIVKLRVGESLVGEGNEVAHIDLLIGPRGSAAEEAFANCLVNNKDGFTSLLAIIAPNLLTKPATVMFNKVALKGVKQIVQLFGPAQYAVAKAIADSVSEGVIPLNEADDLFICVGVFVHWEASDDRKIQEYNYRATKEALDRAIKGEPLASDGATLRSRIRHPFAA